MSHARDELYELKFPEDGDGVIQNGEGELRRLWNLSGKSFEVVGGTGGTFNLTIRYSMNDGVTWHDLLAAQASTVSTTPTAFPAAAEACVDVRIEVAGFSAEGSARPQVFVAGRREN